MAGMEVLSSPMLAIAIFAIVVAASIVQAGLGMGFGLASAPLLALLDPELVPGPVLIIAVVTSIWAAFRERGAINWGELRIGIGGRIAGVVAGSLLLTSLADTGQFTLIFGLLIACAVILSVSGWKLAFNGVTLFIMSSFSGLMGTITSVGAPPMALIYQSRSSKEARPTLAAFFSIGSALSLLGLIFSGWAGWDDFFLAALMVPPMLFGTLIARHIHSGFDKRFRPILLGMAAIAATILILRGLL